MKKKISVHSREFFSSMWSAAHWLQKKTSKKTRANKFNSNFVRKKNGITNQLTSFQVSSFLILNSSFLISYSSLQIPNSKFLIPSSRAQFHSTFISVEIWCKNHIIIFSCIQAFHAGSEKTVGWSLHRFNFIICANTESFHFQTSFSWTFALNFYLNIICRHTVIRWS